MDGEANLEAGLAGLGLEFNLAAMPVGDDAVADGEAKPGAGADELGREERLEHVRLHIFPCTTVPMVACGLYLSLP